MTYRRMFDPQVRKWFTRPMMGKRILLFARSTARTGDMIDMVQRIDELDGIPFEFERIRNGSHLCEITPEELIRIHSNGG